ncbi:hypothetical protein RJ639_014267 [Escallonia herrerae]|uniref:Protein farnesyltransferase subunit beta n=1 Tax=Escallonia herrerae TaxID=1293975 RepID=A0AA88VLF4_9ASTE|nr:hypothetical protein RJ639_014267 [Escallonia herrerae]
MSGSAVGTDSPAAAAETAAATRTVTQKDQWMVESQVFHTYQHYSSLPSKAQFVLLELQRDKHIEFLTKGLRQLGPSFSVLDANRPWLCYWIIHSIALLGDSVDDELEQSAIDFLDRCQDPEGGYGGGPGQASCFSILYLPHLATTYAAVNTLITLGGYRSLSSVNRWSVLMTLKQFIIFSMHHGGEIDVRACYTAISVASALSILDDELVQNVGNYILSCQTYEGGIAGEPGSEAHGGYTFCGFATMLLINEANRLDLARLIDWVVFRQGVEGGFQGRTNKLVVFVFVRVRVYVIVRIQHSLQCNRRKIDQGGVSALMQRLHISLDEHFVVSAAGEGDCSTESTESSVRSDLSEGEQSVEGTSFIVDETRHNREEGHQTDLDRVEGGFRDKPGKSRDHYHTCYCLSGLSVAQYSYSEDADSPPLPCAVLGPYSNLLEPIHPLYNVVLERYYEAYEFFSRR